jgi:hypothetical protein
MYPYRSQNPLQKFFAGLAEQTFESRLGVADPPLIDYLAELLVRFARCDAMYGLRNLAGRRLEEVAEMLVEADQRVGDARRAMHCQIGDLTLFWSGVYPEALRRLQAADRKDHLLDYPAQGKRAYHIASTIPTEHEPPAAEVLERLSREFEMCVYGLGEVRRQWEQEADGGGEAPARLWI